MFARDFWTRNIETLLTIVLETCYFQKPRFKDRTMVLEEIEGIKDPDVKLRTISEIVYPEEKGEAYQDEEHDWIDEENTTFVEMLSGLLTTLGKEYISQSYTDAREFTKLEPDDRVSRVRQNNNDSPGRQSGRKS